MNKRMTTPPGKFVWPHLNTPNTRFNEEGVYEVRLQLEEKDPQVAEFLGTLKGIFDHHYDEICKEKNKKVKTVSYYKTNNDDDNIPEGYVDLKFKMKASGNNKGESWTQRPAIFDAEGTPMMEGTEESPEKIGAGTIGKIAFEAHPYFVPSIGAGVSLKLRACQILELISYSSGGGLDAYGFQKTEGYKTEPNTSTNEYDFA